jgi:hypothetical protein
LVLIPGLEDVAYGQSRDDVATAAARVTLSWCAAEDWSLGRSEREEENVRCGGSL